MQESTPGNAINDVRTGSGRDERARYIESLRDRGGPRPGEYEALLRLNPNDVDALYSLAELYRRQNNRKKVQQTYERILKLEPKKAEVRNALALLYIDDKDYAHAVEQLKMAIQYDPKNLTYQLNLARTYEHAGQLENALAQYKAIYKADPNSDEAKSKIPSLNLQIIRKSREAAPAGTEAGGQ